MVIISDPFRPSPTMITLSSRRLIESLPRSVKIVRKLTALALALASFNSIPTIGRLRISE